MDLWNSSVVVCFASLSLTFLELTTSEVRGFPKLPTPCLPSFSTYRATLSARPSHGGTEASHAPTQGAVRAFGLINHTLLHAY